MMSKDLPTYLLLIEESSNYAFTIRRMQQPLSFDKFRDTSNRFYNDLLEEIRVELHESILRGTCMLSKLLRMFMKYGQRVEWNKAGHTVWSETML